LEVVAWKVLSKENGLKYSIQINDMAEKKEEQLLQAMKDWKKVGFGKSEKNKKIYLFSRDFDNINSWSFWVKKFPFELKELHEEEVIVE
jgi:hypothetical protein